MKHLFFLDHDIPNKTILTLENSHWYLSEPTPETGLMMLSLARQYLYNSKDSLHRRRRIELCTASQYQTGEL